MQVTWSIIVHGGAGNIHDSLEKAHREGCLKALKVGAAILEKNGSALDATCAAARVLEDDPIFNAGIGGALDQRGHVAHDAAVMTGEDLGYGAIAAVVGLRHPIDLARAVLEDGRHCLLAGASALDFARSCGIALCDPQLHLTPKTKREWAHRADQKSGAPDRERDGQQGKIEDWTPLPEEDTIGAVALDSAGRLAAATSTGGTLMRIPGRVGDSPIAGAGTYADKALGAISATGHGETMMRTVFAFRALLALEGAEARPQALQVLDSELEAARAKVGGRGGAIVVLPDGMIAFARNTAHMGVAWQRAGEAPLSAF